MTFASTRLLYPMLIYIFLPLHREIFSRGRHDCINVNVSRDDIASAAYSRVVDIYLFTWLLPFATFVCCMSCRTLPGELFISHREIRSLSTPQSHELVARRAPGVDNRPESTEVYTEREALDIANRLRMATRRRIMCETCTHTDTRYKTNVHRTAINSKSQPFCTTPGKILEDPNDPTVEMSLVIFSKIGTRTSSTYV